MRIPSIRLRLTLTIRAMMIVVAIVAIGFAGWNTKVRWSFCMQEAWILGMMGDSSREAAKDDEEYAENSEEVVKGLEQLLDNPRACC